MRALEASAITGLCKGLRRGSVWNSHSLSFHARDQLLIPQARCECERDRHLPSLCLPHKAKPFLARLTKRLKARLSALEVVPNGNMCWQPVQFTLSCRAVVNSADLALDYKCAVFI